MIIGNEECVPRIASQILIRQELDWTGANARLLVDVALMDLCVHLPHANRQRLVAATHRVGRLIDPVQGLRKAVQWPIDEIHEALRMSVSFGQADFALTEPHSTTRPGEFF